MLSKEDYIILAGIVLVSVLIGGGIWLAVTSVVDNQYARFIRECRALEISMETCERLAANVLGG